MRAIRCRHSDVAEFLIEQGVDLGYHYEVSTASFFKTILSHIPWSLSSGLSNIVKSTTEGVLAPS